VPAVAVIGAAEPSGQTEPAGQIVITPPVQDEPAGQSKGITYPARVQSPAGASTSAAPTVAVTLPAVDGVHAPKPAVEAYPGEHPVCGTPDGQKLLAAHGVQLMPSVVV